MMIKTTSILIGLLSSSVFSQNEIGEKPQDKDVVQNIAQQKAAKLNQQFGNLPKEDRIKYHKLRKKAHRLFSKKRTFEALVVIYDMRAIFKNDPAILNLLGAINVEFRDFDYAREVFKKAISLSGEDPKLLFNMAELAFCDNDWKTCLEQIDYTLLKLQEMEKKSKEAAIAAGRQPSKNSYTDSEFTRIMLFKQMLCHLALSKDNSQSNIKRAAHKAEAIKISGKYDYMIDSPFYYYVKAAFSYYKGDKSKASTWIISAKTVFFNSPSATTSWDDTLVEFGYIRSHYGKHFSEGSDSNKTE